MVNYYRESIAPPLDTCDRGTDTWRKAMSVRLTAKHFAEVLRRGRSSLDPEFLDELLENSCKGLNKQQILAQRYTTFLRGENVGEVGKPEFLGMRTIQGYPELGATPEVTLTVDGQIHHVIFQSVSKFLATDQSLVQGADSVARFPLRKQKGRYYLKKKEDAWFEIAGIFKAFPESFACDFVAYRKSEFLRVVIERDNTTIKSITKDKLLYKMRLFYFAAILPELAHSRKAKGYPLRSECRKKKELDSIIKEAKKE